MDENAMDETNTYTVNFFLENSKHFVHLPLLEIS